MPRWGFVRWRWCGSTRDTGDPTCAWSSGRLGDSPDDLHCDLAVAVRMRLDPDRLDSDGVQVSRQLLERAAPRHHRHDVSRITVVFVRGPEFARSDADRIPVPQDR